MVQTLHNMKTVVMLECTCRPVVWRFRQSLWWQLCRLRSSTRPCPLVVLQRHNFAKPNWADYAAVHVKCGNLAGNELTHLVREHSATVVSACWATVDWSWQKRVDCARANLHLTNNNNNKVTNKQANKQNNNNKMKQRRPGMTDRTVSKKDFKRGEKPPPQLSCRNCAWLYLVYLRGG